MVCARDAGGVHVAHAAGAQADAECEECARHRQRKVSKQDDGVCLTKWMETLSFNLFSAVIGWSLHDDVSNRYDRVRVKSYRNSAVFGRHTEWPTSFRVLRRTCSEVWVLVRICATVSRSTALTVVYACGSRRSRFSDSLMDVIVVGGGLAGMSAAHTVVQAGGRCLVLDKSPFMGGNSTKATSGAYRFRLSCVVVCAWTPVRRVVGGAVDLNITRRRHSRCCRGSRRVSPPPSACIFRCIRYLSACVWRGAGINAAGTRSQVRPCVRSLS